MNLRDYCLANYGNGAALARDLGIVSVQVSQWSLGKPVPDCRVPAIEFYTAFAVTAEELRPDLRWVRVRHPGWPNGKPLLDWSPQATVAASAAEAVAAHAQASPAAASAVAG
jgi:hypothetical protein